MPCCKWGYLPNRVIRDLAANLYGTAIGGGAYAEGVIFNLGCNWERDGAVQLHGRGRRQGAFADAIRDAAGLGVSIRLPR
jgi:hypothetical protein